MTHREKLIMNRIEDTLKLLADEGVGYITDRVQEKGKIYYQIDDVVIVVSVETEN